MAAVVASSAASRNLGLDAELDQLNSGFIDIYDGTRPATPETAVVLQTKLVRCTFGATAFAAASAGSKSANAITSGTGLAAGTAAWARLLKSNGTACFDVNVGTSGAMLIMPALVTAVGGTTAISSLTFTRAAE